MNATHRITIRCTVCSTGYTTRADNRSEALAEAISKGWAIVNGEVKCPKHK